MTSLLPAELLAVASQVTVDDGKNPQRSVFTVCDPVNWMVFPLDCDAAPIENWQST